MNTIDLTNISKEELMELWEAANTTVVNTNKTPKQEMNEYIGWLETNNFGSELMNNLGYELGTSMCATYIHGSEWDEYDEEGNCITKTFKVDKDNPNTKELFEFCFDGLISDIAFLKQFGITTKKPTKKYPYSYYDIDWNVFNKF